MSNGGARLQPVGNWLSGLQWLQWLTSRRSQGEVRPRYPLMGHVWAEAAAWRAVRFIGAGQDTCPQGLRNPLENRRGGDTTVGSNPTPSAHGTALDLMKSGHGPFPCALSTGIPDAPSLSYNCGLPTQSSVDAGCASRAGSRARGPAAPVRHRPRRLVSVAPSPYPPNTGTMTDMLGRRGTASHGAPPPPAVAAVPATPRPGRQVRAQVGRQVLRSVFPGESGGVVLRGGRSGLGADG